MVVKTLSLTATLQQRSVFFQEAEILSQLAHNNILRCLGVVMEGQTDMIVLDYISGGTLADYLACTKFPPSKLLRIAMDLSSAVSYLNTCNVIHGNLRWYVCIHSSLCVCSHPIFPIESLNH